MTYFLVLSVAWACAGDRRVLGLPIRPIWTEARRAAAAAGLCDPRPDVELFSSRSGALRRLEELGPDAAPRLLSCRGLKCSNEAVEWRHTLVVKGT